MPVPGFPDTADAQIYKLRFKRGSNPDCWLLFPFRGGLTNAITRARNYCTTMNYKFLHVEPGVVDLDKSERESLGEEAAG